MPNWCSNTLIITGDKKQIAEFKRKTFLVEVILQNDNDIQNFYDEHIKTETPEKYKADVSNYINVHKMTPKEYIEKIHKFIEKDNGDYIKGGTQLSFNGVLPCPEELHGEGLHSWGGLNAEELNEKRKLMKQKHGYENAYDWHVANWGTKWDACEASLYCENEDELNYTFDTAWGPPCNWLQTIAPMFPKLHFELHYEESGMGFMGTTIAEGDDFSDSCGDIPTCEKCGYQLDPDGCCENEECEDCEDYEQPTNEENTTE